MQKTSFVLVAIFGLLTTVSAQNKTTPDGSDQLINTMHQYEVDVKALNRVYFVNASPEKRERYKRLANDYLSKISSVPFQSLTQEGKADFVLFKRDLDQDIYKADEDAKSYQVLSKWFPFADTIYNFEKIRRRGGMIDGQRVASAFDGILKQLKPLQAKLAEDKSISISDEASARSIITGLQKALQLTYSFYNGYDPLFTWWVPVTYDSLTKQLDAYAAAFKSVSEKNAPKKDNSGITGYPVGRSELIRQLNYELVNYTPEELIEIANKEFAWCDKEMLKASQDMGFGKDWKKALEKVKQSYVAPGEQPAAMVDLYNQSIDFLKKKDLITIPPLAEETWRIVMMSPRQQLLNPFFYGGEEFAVSYPTNTMDYDQKMMSMRGNNPNFSRATVHHELIAGHYLQQFMNERYRYYRNFDTPFWTEGWSLYWEMLLWDEGFPRTPEERVGMLFWRMHRCARIIFSLNYHLGKWTPQECVDFLVDRVGHERANAEGEVRRSFVGSYAPLYQLAYMMGALEIRSLQKEMVKSGKMTLKEFNDAVMHENNMPIEMLRNIIANQPIEKEYKTHWKFYDLK
jgi:hypothetical protein